jgi:type I restriction enzyme S subunit
VPLRDVADYSSTRIPAADVDAMTYVGVDNLLPDKRGKTEATYVTLTGNLTEFKDGDILLGNIRPYLKKVWFATHAGGCSPDVLAVRASDTATNSVIPRFLYFVLSSESFFAFDTQHSHGGKMPRGNKKMILDYPVPVPPIDVQRQVVEVLDMFCDLSAELEAEMEARRLQLMHYRDVLLTSSGTDDVDWVPLGEIADFQYGFTASAQETGDYRFLRITDINQSGKLSPHGAKYVDAIDAGLDCVVETGDILMARTGATYGKTMLVTADEPAIFASFLIRIRFNESVMLPAFYWHFAQSRFYWRQANALVSTGGQPQFNANVLKSVKVPVPDLEEQKRIVSMLDPLDALVNDLNSGLPAEVNSRCTQFEYYRDKLLTFEEAVA